MSSLKINRVGFLPAKASFLCFFTLLITYVLFSLSALANPATQIKGKVLDAQKVSIPYASVALQLASADKNFKGTLTDSLGNFTFSNIPYGSYKVVVTVMGFTSFKSDVFTLSAQNQKINFWDILLQDDTHNLLGVEVVARKKLIEQRLDKMTLNIENSILAEGNTALELLERAPGVKVDDQGKISLKGKSGVTVMINEKLTYLSANELAVLLKATNSSSISKIEVISNPSAKYDASGNAGIINIVLKKNKTKGINGAVNISGGASRNARYGGGFNLNYRSSNLNIYGNYNYAYRGETEYLDFIRRFYKGDQALNNLDKTSVQRTETSEPLNTHNFRFGVDYDIDSTTTIGILLNGNSGKYLHKSNTSNLISNTTNVLLSDMNTSNYDNQNWQSLTYNFNFLHKFNKQGRQITADVDFAPNRFNSNLNLDTYTKPNIEFPFGNTTNRKGTIPSKTDVFVLKTDYNDVIGKAFKWETGLKSSFIKSDNNLVYTLLKNNTWVYDNDGSNHFNYKEQIHAGYLNFVAELGKTSVQAGLRGEYTRTDGNQITTNSSIQRNYFQWFPNLSVDRKLNENNQLQFAYSSRIERPNYGSLNPFRTYRDPSLYYEGNPYLKPELTQNLTFNHVFKSKFTSSLNYSYTKDVITWVTGQNDATNTTFELPKNLPSLINYGISFTAQVDYFKWWTATNFANVFRNEYHLENSVNKLVSFNANTQNSFKLNKTLSAELNAYYNSKSVYGILTERSFYAVSAALQKNILDGKGSVKLAVNDIFDTVRFRSDTKYENINMNSTVWIDSRRAILSFSYRFGKELKSRERKTGSEDIQDRIKK